jgi:hypothetical protein
MPPTCGLEAAQAVQHAQDSVMELQLLTNRLSPSPSRAQCAGLGSTPLRENCVSFQHLSVRPRTTDKGDLALPAPRANAHSRSLTQHRIHPCSTTVLADLSPSAYDQRAATSWA